MSLQVELLFGALFLLNVGFYAAWVACRKTYVGRKRPLAIEYPLGFVFAFFDTLGIGSFAPTTAALKFQGKIADELIPGTLNIGLNMAATLEMIIFVTAIAINPVLLMATILSAALGAWVGAGVVNRMPISGESGTGKAFWRGIVRTKEPFGRQIAGDSRLPESFPGIAGK